MRLEDGKYYRTRDGRKVGPMRACGTSSAFFSNKGTMWYSNGDFYPGMPSEHDIVAEWTTKDDHIERTKRMIEVMQAYVDGKAVGDVYGRVERPCWNWIMYDYRIIGTPDSINWDHVAPEFKYMARDEEPGRTLLFTEKPKILRTVWTGGRTVFADVYSSYRKGTADWKDSLVIRPGCE